MTKENRKALLEERIKVIANRGKAKGSYGVLHKLQRRLAKNNF